MIGAGQAVREAERRLTAAGIESARLDAVLLVAFAAQLTPDAVRANPARPLAPDAEGRLVTLLRKRAQDRIPVSRLIGKREFWSLPFSLSPAVLDPRPDSETLVEAVIRHTENRAAPMSIFDLGVGTGCLLLALLTEFSNATGKGSDIDGGAIAIARENARNLKLAGRADFLAGDGFADQTGPFDWIVTNPPYIPSGDLVALTPEVRNHDPVRALDGGADGLEVFRKITPHLATRLRASGRVAAEFGDGQAAAVKELFSDNDLVCLDIARDLSGRERVIVAETP